MSKESNDNIWLNPIDFSENKQHKIVIGALQIYITQLIQEWQFKHRFVLQDESLSEQKISITSVASIQVDNLELNRFIQSDDINQLHIKPRLANRSIVAKPHTPVFLPSKQAITIYVSTPLWIAFYLNGFNQPLFEMATFKLSDTWFGPRPHVGELCYASRFSGRIDLKALPRRPSRVITPITISNNGDDNLKLEKIAIPSEYLSVYLTKNSELWTPTLKVTREKDQKNTRVIIDKNLHPALQDATKISEPRTSDQSGLFTKTLDMLFS
ncbi:hypothetical protein ACUR5C_01275 [Aliikangiella sp. IMCC44653]